MLSVVPFFKEKGDFTFQKTVNMTFITFFYWNVFTQKLPF